jgi:cytochrome c
MLNNHLAESGERCYLRPLRRAVSLWKDNTMKKVFAVCVAGIMIALAQQVLAADDNKKKWVPDPLRGQSTSERLCISCHLVKPGQAGNVIAGVPSFAAIANRPDQSSTRITNVLMQSHPAMPTVSLTLHEIGDIIAYLDTLRNSTSGDPLIEKTPKPRMKPKYPDQS